MENSLLILGAGGHAKVLADAVLKQDKYAILGFLDDGVQAGTPIFDNYTCLGKLEDFVNFKATHFIVAFGNNQLRKKWSQTLSETMLPAKIIHPKAILASNVEISAGSVVLAGAVINSNTTIAENVIVNSSVVVDHDCVIGANSHLSIGTLVGSNSKVSPETTTAIGELISSFSRL